ncbi:hypothetical protein [Streptomyces sp. NPDC045369]|uniref:hypothetical protein n=1 Tax=Streptomyces sp. NPDC045369 TaxID=3155732 RepID=UPI0033E0F23A
MRADEELVLAHQLLAQFDQRATVLYAQVAALVRDVGTDRDVTNRATIVCTEATAVGLLGSFRCWRSASPSTTPYATPTTT